MLALQQTTTWTRWNDNSRQALRQQTLESAASMSVVLLFAHTTQAVIIARPFFFTVLYFLRAKGPRMKESCVSIHSSREPTRQPTPFPNSSSQRSNKPNRAEDPRQDPKPRVQSQISYAKHFMPKIRSQRSKANEQA